ncbi:MAG TPA: hypothetical protein VLA43_12865 [Longimicrobiales bacterium]|nr:hypothetical protein [Longimicrobiales bacterium]
MNRRRYAPWLGLALLGTLCALPASGLQATDQDDGNRPPATRPVWAVEGVPDTVWLLVEAEAATPDRDRGKEILKEAEVHARAAVEGHEDDAGRRFALAVVLGLRADREGGRTKVRAASELHDELEVILELDPDHAPARHLLGRLHAGVLRMNRITRWVATNLLGGDALKAATWEEAERNLLFAAQRIPEVGEHHLQLANLYRDTDRTELALEEIEHVLALPAETPLAEATRGEALELREKLGG